MKPIPCAPAAGWSDRFPRRVLVLVIASALLALAGCRTVPGGPAAASPAAAPRPAELPARIIGNFFLVEARQSDGSTRRFVIDTGSTATHVSADLARAIGRRESGAARRPVRVRSATGAEVSLEPVTLRRLQLGDARFERVPAFVYDFTELSTHLGLTIDGLIGFPVFRDTVLTLDYPGARFALSPQPASAPGGSTIAFNNEQNIPLIPVQMGNESFVVLLDSGSDGGLHLNPTGLHPRFRYGPRPGTVVSTLAGDRQQMVGRLGQDVLLGSHVIENPVVDLTDQLSAVGGEILRHFVVHFDQRHNRVTFVRSAGGPVRMEPRRSTGLAIARSPVYWRVMDVIADTPSTRFGVQAGDLIVRINGEPVARWDYQRYAALLGSAARITYTFLTGSREFELELPVFDLVP